MSGSVDPEPRRIWLVRHGETEWARLGRHTGRTDVPLTDLGRDQATALGDRLRERERDGRPPFALVLTSPRIRASETARLAGFPAATIESDLAEWDYGALEGMLTSAIRERYPDWSIWTGPWPDGETAEAVGRRADRVLAKARATDGDVLLFSHGHLLRVLAARWVGLYPSFGRLFSLSTGTVSILGWDRENPAIETWNEDCHLTGLAD
jgi:probable phosphoglycerate mutase